MRKDASLACPIPKERSTDEHNVKMLVLDGHRKLVWEGAKRRVEGSENEYMQFTKTCKKKVCLQFKTSRGNSDRTAKEQGCVVTTSSGHPRITKREPLPASCVESVQVSADSTIWELVITDWSV